MLRLLERLARGAITSAVGIASRVRVPTRLDGAAAYVARGTIKIYRVLLSPWLGRQCLFHPSCSGRALAYLGERGWNGGMPLAHAQLARCTGHFTLHLTANDELELVTADGEVFSQAELAPRVVSTYAPVNLLVPPTAGQSSSTLPALVPAARPFD